VKEIKNYREFINENRHQDPTMKKGRLRKIDWEIRSFLDTDIHLDDYDARVMTNKFLNYIWSSDIIDSKFERNLLKMISDVSKNDVKNVFDDYENEYTTNAMKIFKDEIMVNEWLEDIKQAVYLNK
jgi:hypothetical protein